MAAAVLAPPVSSPQARSAGPALVAALRVAGSVVAVWEMRARTRAALRRLDASLHDDLGLARADILREVAKPFWRA